MPIKILIADDHRLFREGLVNLLSESVEIEIVAQAENGMEAIKMAKTFTPDIIIMDIGMPLINGVEATAILKNELPEAKVIALSMHTEKQFIKGMLEAGAFGYLFKNCTYNQLIEAIKIVFDGERYLSNEITEVLIHDYIGKQVKIDTNEPELTDRELEILKLFAEGYSTRHIADKIFVSVKTVGSHKKNILEKLNLKTTTDLVKYALRKEIISLS